MRPWTAPRENSLGRSISGCWRTSEERRKSLIADLAVGIIAGFGARSYLLGFDALIAHLEDRDD